ncbi:unnamed protein product [Leuciscus chuanchicus]
MIKAVSLLSDMQEGSLSKEVNGTDPMVTGMDENEIDEVHSKERKSESDARPTTRRMTADSINIYPCLSA